MMPDVPPDPAPRKYLRPRPTPDLPPLRAKRVLDQLRERLRLMHYSLRTEETYVYWVKAFIRFHGLRHPAEMGGPEVEAFLTHLADGRSVAPSSHRLALQLQVKDLDLAQRALIEREGKRAKDRVVMLPQTLVPNFGINWVKPD